MFSIEGHIGTEPRPSVGSHWLMDNSTCKKMSQNPQPEKTIRCLCNGCGGRFQAPAASAGKTVKCPKCKSPIHIPDGSPKPKSTAGDKDAAGGTEASWFVRTADGAHHGPMPKTELDRMVADNRLDELCQLRQADWSDWRWIDTVYRQFATTDLDIIDTADAQEPVAAESRLQECPDCGKIVSRRATQCPNCGCPVAAVSRLESTRPGPVERKENGGRNLRSKKTIILSVLSLVLLVLLGCIGVVGWLLWQKASRPAEILTPILQPLPAAVETQPAAVEAASPEQIATWIDEIAESAARQVDDEHRQIHTAQAGIQAMQAQAELLDSLVSGDFAKPASHDKKRPAPKPIPPYESQYETLYQECVAYLRDNLDPQTAGRAAIVEMANRWSEARRPPLQKVLEGVGGR